MCKFFAIIFLILSSTYAAINTTIISVLIMLLGIFILIQCEERFRAFASMYAMIFTYIFNVIPALKFVSIVMQCSAVCAIGYNFFWKIFLGIFLFLMIQRLASELSFFLAGFIWREQYFIY